MHSLKAFLRLLLTAMMCLSLDLAVLK
ncbi:UNVERIFIED_CONTAM: hypothetical protein GTU68_004159 [Idotea baltica]|nr:hypothetical protein [Idotea baltica]